LVLIAYFHENECGQFEKVLSAERAGRTWASVKDPSKNNGYIDRVASIAQVKSKQTLFDFPLIILTCITDSDKLNKYETNFQVELLTLSTPQQAIFFKTRRPLYS